MCPQKIPNPKIMSVINQISKTEKQLFHSIEIFRDINLSRELKYSKNLQRNSDKIIYGHRNKKQKILECRITKVNYRIWIKYQRVQN